MKKGERREKGSGTIGRDYRPGDAPGKPTGPFHGQITLPNKRRRSVYGKTQREVKEKMAALRREVDAGMHGTTAGEQTFRQFAESWLAGHRHSLEEKTIDGYEGFIRNHFDGIGDLPLAKLTPQAIQNHYTSKLQTLAPVTVAHIHNFFHLVLEHAVKLGIIPRNYADYVDAPGGKSKEFTPLSEPQVTALLAVVAEDRLGALFMLIIATGMREAEILGLRWQDVDLARGSVTVAGALVARPGGVFRRKVPKSATSKRTLRIPQWAIDALARYAAIQDEEKAMIGAAWGNEWDLVFTTEAGRPIRYDWLIDHFRKLLALADLPLLTRIHDLRHTFATVLLARGVDIKVVSELLGHSGISITLGTYAHVTRGMRDAALGHLEELMPGKIVESADE